MDACTGLGNGELDFYATMAEFDSAWANIETSDDYYDVWIPYKKNPDTGMYEYVTYQGNGNYNYDPSNNLTGSPLWGPGYPSYNKECVACAIGWGCYDTSCSETKKLNKCKFPQMRFLHILGLCEGTALGK